MAPNPCAHCRTWPRNRTFCTPREFDCQNFVGTRRGQYDLLEGRLPRSPDPCDYCARKRKRLACSTADPRCQNRVLLDQGTQLGPSYYNAYQHGITLLQPVDTTRVGVESETERKTYYSLQTTKASDYSAAQAVLNSPAMISGASMSGPFDGDLMDHWFPDVSTTDSQMIIDDAFKDGCFSAQESLVRADLCARDFSDWDLWMTRQSETSNEVGGAFMQNLDSQSAYTSYVRSEYSYTGTNPRAARTGAVARSGQHNDQSPLLCPSKEYSEFSSYTGTNPHVKRAVLSPPVKTEDKRSGLDVHMVFSDG